MKDLNVKNIGILILYYKIQYICKRIIKNGKMKTLKLFVIILLFSVAKGYSQYSTTGTNFWLSFHENFESNANPILYITSDIGATGTVTIPGVGWSQNFTVGVNASVTINLPAASAIISQSNTVLNRAVHVTSSTAVAVYAANQRGASSDATIVLPVHALGDRYIVNTYSTFSSYQSQFVVVGVQDNTSIQITPSANVQGGVNAGVPFVINLNQGQVYFVRSIGDLTGTLVKAVDEGNCNDFAVFSGNKCANVPLSCTYCDHLFEQMIPVKAWGKEYITAPLMTRNGDQFRILASENGTNVSINGGANIVLNASQFHEFYHQQSCYIVSDKPIAVAHYSRGTSCDGVTSDPFMIMLSPIEQTLTYIVFQAFNTPVINNFYTNVITKTAHTNQVLLDGATIPGWTTVPSNPQYSYVRRNIAQGTHVLQSPEGILAFVYGFGNADSYGYTAGANIQPLDVTYDIIIGNDSVAFDVFMDSINCEQTVNGVGFYTDGENITDVSFNLGDGTIVEGNSVFHYYQNSGTYTVTMYFTRIGSCAPDSLSMQVHVTSELPPFSFINDTVICNGSPFTIYPGASGVNYLWHNGSTNSYMNVNTTGTYAVTISDNFGCSATASADVEFVNFSLTTTINNISCSGMNDGSLTVNPNGGIPPYSYSWNTSPPLYTQTISNLGEGSYYVTVIEGHGCTAATSAAVIDPEEFFAQINNLQNVRCYGAANGSVNVTVNGGLPPYGIAWSSGNISGFNPQNLGPGNYSLTVSDVNGCTYDRSFSITQPSQLSVNYSLNNALCYGEPVSATINVSGGTSAYSVVWQDGSTNYSNSNIPANTEFGYTVTDGNNCVQSGTLSVTSPAEMLVNGTIKHVTCKGDSDGTIRIHMAGNTPPYDIRWSTGEDTVFISGKPAGFYTVTITDANDCTAVHTFNVTEADEELELIYFVNDIQCHGSNQGSIVLDASGGITPYSFRLGAGNYEVGGNVHSGLSGGQYNFRVIDARGCSVNATSLILEPAELQIITDPVRPSCIGNDDGRIGLNISGGTEPYHIRFNDRLSTSDEFEGLRQGEYNIEILDANNCVKKLTIIKLVDMPVDCIVIPNAFTPNGDGINDTWIIENIEMFPDATIDVFNRWGQIMYSGRGNSEPWDGKLNKKKLPTGPYVYVIDLRNGNKAYKGTVTLIH